jgi:hypothetical protein
VIQCDFFVENGYFRYGSLSDNREPFNGRLRDELLNETLFGSLANVRAALTEWQLDCNTVSPPGSLGNLPPGRLRQAQRPASQRDRDAARDRGCAPFRCSIEPTRVKWPTASTHRWMRNRAQVEGVKCWFTFVDKITASRWFPLALFRPNPAGR